MWRCSTTLFIHIHLVALGGAFMWLCASFLTPLFLQIVPLHPQVLHVRLL